MNNYTPLARLKQMGVGLAFLVYPILAGTAFAFHPNLFSLSISHDVNEKIAEFHGNSVLHFGHVLMLLGAPLLIVVAIHLMNVMEKKAVWWGFLGGILAVFGAVILAADKGALCLVPSAFDTLPETDFRGLAPGIAAMFQYRGWLWLLWLLPILPMGFILQTIGLVRSNLIPRWQSIPMLIGSVLMANPDVDLIGLIATIFLAIGFFPYAFQLLRSANTRSEK